MKLFVFLTIITGFATASPIFLAFDPFLNAVPGDTLTISGTLDNTSSDTVFINSDTLSLDDSSLISDDSLFLNNAPISLDPGQVSASFQMFTVMIPLATPFGQYSGELHIIGGADGNANLDIGSSSFTANVVPEPASVLLLAPALLFVFHKRRRG
jgi:hypothetical protein